MTLPLTWLADVLRAAGCTVVELTGWRTRGQTDGPFAPRAVMWHHDASPAGDSPYVPAMMADLRNNGAQCWVDRAGRWHLVAAGRMWHAGSGPGWGRIPNGGGNIYSIGVETDHTTGEGWPAGQLASLRSGTRALLRQLGADPADALCGHKEYAPGRKIDPDGLDMAIERRLVAATPPEEDDMSVEDSQRIREIQAALGTAEEATASEQPGGVQVGTQIAQTRAGVRELLARPPAPAPAPVEIDYDRLAAALLRRIAGPA